MQSGAVTFGAVFVLLPLLLLVLAMALPAFAVALGIVAIVLLATGFTLGVAALPP
jgi:hypothetical protein